MKWIEDPGHAWLKVKLAEYPDAPDSGTGYGYQDREHIYLEEDCEAVHFLHHHPEIDPSTIPVQSNVRDFNRNQHNARRWAPYINGEPSAELLEIIVPA